MFIATRDIQLLKAPAGRHVYSAESKFQDGRINRIRKKRPRIDGVGIIETAEVSESRIKQMNRITWMSKRSSFFTVVYNEWKSQCYILQTKSCCNHRSR